MRKFYLIAFMLLLVGLCTVVFAAPPDQGQPGPQGFEKQQPHHAWASFLNLTQEQREKMKQIRKGFFADTHNLRYDIRMKMVEMKKLFTDPNTDGAAILAKQKELDDLIVKLMDRKAQMRVEWRSVLTPEQIRKLDRPHPFHRFFHGGGPGEPGPRMY